MSYKRERGATVRPAPDYLILIRTSQWQEEIGQMGAAVQRSG